jgi:hypothetical protein
VVSSLAPICIFNSPTHTTDVSGRTYQELPAQGGLEPHRTALKYSDNVSHPLR